MLSSPEQFCIVEDALREKDIIREFEKVNGKIRGRMMIIPTSIPDGFNTCSEDTRDVVGFEGSFDFYDASIGIAVRLSTKEFVSGLWITAQVEKANEPSEEWVNFFLERLLHNIGEDGSYGVPVCSFATDTSDFTVYPIHE